MLVGGMILNACGGAFGLARINNVKPTVATKVASILSLTALWMSSVGMIMLFTLPFSKGQYFNFNPDPTSAAVVASIVLPIIGPLMIMLASRTIPVPYPASILTGMYVAVNGTTTVAAHYAIAPALPYYLLNILLGIAVDLVLRRNLSERVKAAMTGAIIGPFFFTMYFPLVTHAFRESLGISVDVFVPTISLFQSTYQTVMSTTSVPAILFGFLGSLIAYAIADRLLKPNS